MFDANSELVNIGIDQPNIGAKRCPSLSSLDTIQPLWKHLDIVDSDSDDTSRYIKLQLDNNIFYH